MDVPLCSLLVLQVSLKYFKNLLIDIGSKTLEVRGSICAHIRFPILTVHFNSNQLYFVEVSAK